MNNNAQTTNKSNNAAILSLLNSSPANLTQQKVQPRRISLNASIPSRVNHGNVISVPNTTGQVNQLNLSRTLGTTMKFKQIRSLGTGKFKFSFNRTVGLQTTASESNSRKVSPRTRSYFNARIIDARTFSFVSRYIVQESRAACTAPVS